MVTSVMTAFLPSGVRTISRRRPRGWGTTPGGGAPNGTSRRAGACASSPLMSAGTCGSITIALASNVSPFRGLNGASAAATDRSGLRF